MAEELESGQDRVQKLQAEMEKTLSKLDDVLGFSKSKSNSSRLRSSSIRTRIPLRSFLFGTRLKKQKQSGLFSCMNPAFQNSEMGTFGRVGK